MKILSIIPLFLQISCSGNSDRVKVKSEKTEDKFRFIEGISLQSALDSAVNSNKILVVYFSGHGCSDCRLLEQNIFSDSIVRNMINDEFVFMEYFADEFSGDRSPVLEFQKKEFNKEVQPYFAIINPNGKLKAELGMTRKLEEFKQFLKSGLI